MFGSEPSISVPLSFSAHEESPDSDENPGRDHQAAKRLRSGQHSADDPNGPVVHAVAGSLTKSGHFCSTAGGACHSNLTQICHDVLMVTDKSAVIRASNGKLQELLLKMGTGSISAGQRVLQDHLQVRAIEWDQSSLSVLSYTENLATHNNAALVSISVHVTESQDQRQLLWAILDCTQSVQAEVNARNMEIKCQQIFQAAETTLGSFANFGQLGLAPYNAYKENGKAGKARADESSSRKSTVTSGDSGGLQWVSYTPTKR